MEFSLLYNRTHYYCYFRSCFFFKSTISTVFFSLWKCFISSFTDPHSHCETRLKHWIRNEKPLDFSVHRKSLIFGFIWVEEQELTVWNNIILYCFSHMSQYVRQFWYPLNANSSAPFYVAFVIPCEWKKMKDEVKSMQILPAKIICAYGMDTFVFVRRGRCWNEKKTQK